MAGYVYRGNEPYLAEKTPAVRRRAPLTPFDPALCGTNAGYHQHYRYRQQQCEACMEAHRAYDAAYRARRKTHGLTRKTASRKAAA